MAHSILIVEDTKQLHDAFVWVFKTEGFEVFAAETGQDALVLYDDEVPTHVLLDLGLPDISGWEVMQQIRQRPTGSNTRIILLTGYANAPQHPEAGLADTILFKPIDLDELFKLARELE